MAILYVFRIVDPNNVGAFPPTVLASDWFEKISKFHLDNSVSLPTESGALIIFNSESELNNYINEHKLTDATLISDINFWKSTHNVSYSFNYYALNSVSGINPTPIC